MMISHHILVNLVQLSYIVHIVHLKCNDLDLLQEFNFLKYPHYRLTEMTINYITTL